MRGHDVMNVVMGRESEKDIYGKESSGDVRREGGGKTLGII